MRGVGFAGVFGAVLAVALLGVAPAVAGMTGEAACAEFFASTGTQSLFLTVPPPQPVVAPVAAAKGKKKKRKKLAAPSQPTYVDLQVGCTAAGGDGDVADSQSLSTANPNQTLVVQVLSSGEPAGRCDAGPLGLVSTEVSGDNTVAVKLSTTCNYRSFGGSGQGACAKCYQVRVRFEITQR